MGAQTSDYGSWIGRRERRRDTVSVVQARQMLATLDDVETRLDEGDPLPPLWHFMLFQPDAPMRDLDTDGHPRRGGFLPPIALPRRMFAGASYRYFAPLPIGGEVRREGEITSIEEKQGKTGRLVFVTAVFNIYAGDRRCLEETQNIVYREAGAPTSEPQSQQEWAPLPDAAWSRVVTPDPVVLFRYSALTFNAHRIHYDRDYTVHEEGYPGLIVHGPLIATYLCELVRAHGARPVRALRFRARAPIFDTAAFRLVGIANGDTVALEAQRCDGETAMVMSVELGAPG